MKLRPRLLPSVLLSAVLALNFLGTKWAVAQPAWSLTRPAASFDRSELTRPEFAEKIRSGGTLSGAKNDWGITGRVEYDVEVPRSGWYELTVRGSGREVEYVLDPGSSSTSGPVAVYSSSGHSLVADKVGNFWLAAGRHTLRLQRYFWTGFPRIESFTLTAASPALAKSMRAALADSTGTYRLHECAPMEVFFGGRSIPTVLTIRIKDATGRLRRSDSLPIVPSSDLLKQSFALPCDEPGVFTVAFGENGNDLPYPDVRWLGYEVMDTAGAAREVGISRSDVDKAGSALIKTLVEEIDCVHTPPDYHSGGETRVNSTASGVPYRESGDTGFTRYQRAPSDALRKMLPEPSWFAYRLHNVVAHQSYLVEVDYPDDRLRTFAIALRESAPLSYPVAGGVDSGGEFSLSNAILTESLLYWPRAEGTRVTLLNAHDGRRAAASRIRVYRLDGALPPLVPPSTSGRQFLNWYEEGTNFLSMYGAADRDTSATGAATRWASAVRYAGGTILGPTVAVYSFALYPSQYNRAFSKPDDDMLRRLLLVAEQTGLKVLPELHPRADELNWSDKSVPDPRPNLLLSKDGKTSAGLPPLFNPLYPANQDWYVGMIGELVDRYRDSPALLGVNLRLMQWANPALNNFHSLDWGYDDYSVALFVKETGSAVPMGESGDKSRFAERYRWLMANARTRWIDWRCRKIAGLYMRIRDRVRQARPDLKVFSSVFRWKSDNDPVEALRGAGIDPAMLREISGVELINATHGYGRNEADALATQASRDALVDPRYLTSITGSGHPGSFLTGAAYLEITEAVAPPRSLGFPANTKLTWTSATANPAGRHHLERFAVELAETDAKLMGDGGNAYSLGQPVLREFLSEYLRLPAEPFSPRADARDPVAVWERVTPDASLFYAVNRERYPVTVELTLSAGASAVRLARTEKATLVEGRLRIDLQPYQLLAYSVSRGARVLRVDTRVPPAQRDLVASQVRWVEALARDQQDKWLAGIDVAEKNLLGATAHEAAGALDRGNLWRARTALESRGMLSLYRKLNRYPPGLREHISAN
jgi:hypothetical protein